MRKTVIQGLGHFRAKMLTVILGGSQIVLTQAGNWLTTASTPLTSDLSWTSDGNDF